jgi:signal transduction histidine kinase/CheY-like chemotaxis protein
MAGALVGGLTWGLGVLWMMPAHRLDLQFLIILVVCACAFASLAAFGSYPAAFYLFFLASVGPSLVWALMQGDLLHLVYAALGLIWLPAVVVLARRFSDSLTRAMTLQHAYAEQKAIAEQASVAKSRFLASASHDLRQPVHALGMFLGALRGHRLSRDTREILEHMDASVDALDGLFTALLDISRLDGRVTQVRLEPVALDPLLARICREAQVEAEAKGVRLARATTSLWIESDPILLERILRNLVANAVRYTEAGEVLVGCRRSGSRVRLEVWDTGPGIRPEHRRAIFEEFYQVANPDRDRAKGLGLGLAIVRRLTELLAHPLTLESEAGRGSVFRVSAPRAEPAGPGAADLARAFGPPSASILAVEDDAAVRDAMARLLEGWGHRVLACRDGGEALAAMADGLRPDLIICDYRLPGGENGIEVVRRLQAIGAGAPPALLITGDTAPERLREAEASGLPVLHKPVSSARLRAAVQALTARRSEALELKAQ